MRPDRILQFLKHDDGTNAWDVTRVSPPAYLRDQITGYAHYSERTGGFTTRRELPHGEGVLIVNLGEPISITGGNQSVLKVRAGEAFIAGVHLSPALSHSCGTQAGIHVFLSLPALRCLLNVPMDQLVDRVVSLEDLLGQSARQLGDQLGDARNVGTRTDILDAALRQRLADCQPLSQQQRHAVKLLRAQPDRDIADIAHEVGWSRKHLADRVTDAVGVGPRSFRRLLRFQKLTVLMSKDLSQANWAGLAHDAGYCDQSHMIREFREFAGLTPSTWLARSLPDGGGLVEG